MPDVEAVIASGFPAAREYRDAARITIILERLRAVVRGTWTIMEICGGHTHVILQSGIETLLPEQVALVHGPGCPVCVTPVGMVDAAIALASRDGIVLATYGDMLRVPGTRDDLQSARAQGGHVAMISSPLDALRLAQRTPDRTVVFFGIGFETTAPATAEAILLAQRLGLRNFTVLCAHVLVPPAIEALLSAGTVRFHGLIAPGHVCTITGLLPWQRIASAYRVPMVITGFEPLDIMQSIHLVVSQLESGKAEVQNQYARAVRPEGNPRARAVLEQVFSRIDRTWRGIGPIRDGGLAIREQYREFDAAFRYGITEHDDHDSGTCISGSILQGNRRPTDCPAFGNVCTPEHPLGAPMVSSEGACAAYYHYRSVERPASEHTTTAPNEHA